MAKKVLIFDFKPSEKEFFDENNFEDFEISFFEGSLNEKTLKNVSINDKENAEIISIFITSDINREVLESFKKLKIIATRSTSSNHINLEECLEHNVAVTNVAAYGERTVVQFTIGLIILLVRKILLASQDIKNFNNFTQNYVGNDLEALTLGVIGTGIVGTGICKAAYNFGMTILANDIKPNLKLEEKYNLKYVDFETLIKDSDIITIHIPYNDENYHMFSKSEFSRMKKNAYLINTSRGELIDTKALYNTLVQGEIEGCAIDVSECEDFTFDTENFLQKIPETTHNCLGRALIIQKIMQLPNAIVTPHIAYNTKEAVESILKTTMENIKAFYKGKKINRIV